MHRIGYLLFLFIFETCIYDGLLRKKKKKRWDQTWYPRDRWTIDKAANERKCCGGARLTHLTMNLSCSQHSLHFSILFIILSISYNMNKIWCVVCSRIRNLAINLYLTLLLNVKFITFTLLKEKPIYYISFS